MALVLAALTFLPWSVWIGTIRPEELAAYQVTVRGWLIFIAIAAPAAVLLSVVRGRAIDARFNAAISAFVSIPSKPFVFVAAIVMSVAGALLSRLLFAHNPHLVDTIAQLFQARIFAAGSFTAPAPPQMEFFAASHLVEHAGRWFSQYPPGHPALLAVGIIAGIPWVVNPLFAAGTVVLVCETGRRLLGEGSGRLAAMLYLVSPFVIMMSASYMNHVTTGFFLALGFYSVVRSIDEGGYAWPAIAGGSLAFAMTIRPLESVAWAVVLGSWILARRGLKPALVTTVVCAIGLLPLLAYNALTVGHPLRFGYTLLWGSEHGLGFHTDPWGNAFTPLLSFANTALDFQRLNDYLLGWPLPSLVFILAAIAGAIRYQRARSTSVPLLLLLFAGPVAYFFYWHRDDYLGPRFLYSSVVPAVLLTAMGIAALDRWAGRWRPAYRLLLIAGAFYGLVLTVPERAGVISGLEGEMKLHPEAQVAEQGIEDGVVFVKVSWGSRLIGRLWGWRVPASEVEQSFRVVDGCRIQMALDTADSLAASGADSARVLTGLRSQLDEWRQDSLTVIRGLLPDPSVRADTTRDLEPRCRLEAGADRSGFTLYETLIWRNDPSLERGTIFARFLEPERNRALLQRYPGRDVYLYAPLTAERGELPRLLRLELNEPPPPGSEAGE
jgi:hypothetical protein